jgi:hypothetical protein
MNLFLKKVLLFVGSVIVITVLSVCFNKIYLKVNHFFKLSSNVHILILGDSRTRYGLDDKYLNQTKNFSSDADSYFYSYTKLKELKENNPQIDTLILSFSKHNIVKSIENRWLLNNAHLKERLLVYFPILNKHEILFLLHNKPTETVKNVFSQVTSTYKYFIKKQGAFGGYKELEYSMLQKEIEKQKAEAGKEPAFEEAPIEKMYLRKIADYCKENHIKLILLNMPSHKALMGNKEVFYSFYKRNFSDVTFLDFGNIELSDDDYGDLVHLSPKGSEYFTRNIFIKGLQNLNKENKLAKN